MSKKKPRIDINDIKEEIKSTWFWYKVCNGCEAVAMFSDIFCPKCRGYNFDENRKRIIDQIILKYEEKFKRNSDLELTEQNDLDSD